MDGWTRVFDKYKWISDTEYESTKFEYLIEYFPIFNNDKMEESRYLLVHVKARA